MFEAGGAGVPRKPDGHETATRGTREELSGRAGGISQSPGATGSGVNKQTNKLRESCEDCRDISTHSPGLTFCSVFTAYKHDTAAFVLGDRSFHLTPVHHGAELKIFFFELIFFHLMFSMKCKNVDFEALPLRNK